MRVLAGAAAVGALLAAGSATAAATTAQVENDGDVRVVLEAGDFTVIGEAAFGPNDWPWLRPYPKTN